MEATGFGTISANPETLLETAERAYRQIAEYRRGLEAVAALVKSSESFWVGEAGDAYREVFNAEAKKVNEALDEFAAYPSELLEYAGIYSEAIAKAGGYASSVSEFRMV